MIAPAVRTAALLLAIATAAAVSPSAGSPSQLPQAEPNAPNRPTASVEQQSRAPFQAGERFSYEVRFGGVKVGASSMEIRGLDVVRGRPAWHTVFVLRGGIPFYRVNDVLESWIDTASFSSLRFKKRLEEGTRERAQHFEIFPERGTYLPTHHRDPSELKSVRQPLDDGSFLYFVRTIPLVVGETYDFNRYFIPDRNPVRIRVLRRERIRVPAGTFDAIVVQPIIKAKGIFSQDGEAEVWLSDDTARMVLQLKTRLPVGSLNLHLTSYQLSTRPAAASTGN